MAAAPGPPAARPNVADSAQRAAESAAPLIGRPAIVSDFATIRQGQWLRVWIAGGDLIEGSFREAREESGALFLHDRTDSIPFSSIDVFAVRHTYTGQMALLVGGALGVSTAMTMAALCGIFAGGACEASEYVQPVAVATGIGVALGGLIGATRTSWDVRFRRE